MRTLHRWTMGVAALRLAICSAQAQTVIDEWANAKFPKAPELKSAKIVPGETALLVMDFTNQQRLISSA